MDAQFIQLRENILTSHYHTYKDFLLGTEIYERKENNNIYSTAIFDGKYHGVLKISDVKDKEVFTSIEEFLHIIDNCDETTKKNLLIYVNSLLQFMEADYGNGNKSKLKEITIEDTLIRIIACYFWELKGGQDINIKKGERTITCHYEASSKKGIKVNDSQSNINCTYEDYISIIESMLDPSYNAIPQFLNITRNTRNRTTHNMNRFFKLDDDRIRCMFKLYTLLASILTLRKSLGENIEDYKLEQIELQFQSEKNAPTSIVIEDITSRERIKEERKKERATFYIERFRQYTISIPNEKDSKPFVENIYCGWNSLTPIVEFDGTSIRFSPNECNAEPSVYQVGLRHTMKSIGNVLETLTKIGKSVDSIDGNTQKILMVLQEIGEKQDATNASIISQGKTTGEKLDALQLCLGDKLDKLIEAQNTQNKRTREEILPVLLTFLESMERIRQEESGTIVETIKKESDKTRESIKEGNEQNNKNFKWQRILLLFIILLISGVILYVLFREPINSLFSSKPLTPAELVAQGDSLYKLINDQKMYEAGEAWRAAIAGYEKELEQNPNNDSIHIALAVMYMRGKGYYDLEKAIDHARQAKTERGRGLYAYLLTRINEFELAREIYANADLWDDEYLQLSKIITDLYGANEEIATKRTRESIQDAYIRLGGLSNYNQEALFEWATLKFNGIKDEQNNYIVMPDVGIAFEYLAHLEDSVSPVALALYSDKSLNIEKYGRFYAHGFAALYCGVTDVVPILRMVTIELGDSLWDNPKDVLTTLQKWEQESSILNDFANLVQNVHKGDEYIDLAVKKIDEIVFAIEEKQVRNLYFDEDFLKRTQITLHLASGDTIKSVKLAMQKDNCSDSIAVGLYLRGIMYAKGYADTPIDTIISDSLINLAAERGYAEAIYTRLRKTPPMKVESNFLSRNISVYPSKNTLFADSIWKANPKIAAELNNYWHEWSWGGNRYIPYCPIEYQAVAEYLDNYEITYPNSTAKIQKVISEEKVKEIFKEVQIGIATALQNGHAKVFYQLCHIWINMAKMLRDKDPKERLNISPTAISCYEELLEDTKFDTKTIEMNYPVYAY